MKYDTDVDISNGNTSHAIVAALVGQAKRVLDVGCSTGYLARILKGNANSVSGVEIDEQAAEQAKPALDRLVLGDVETMDFVENFGENFGEGLSTWSSSRTSWSTSATR
ncbi:MAG: class I SAM-dependent methyltransferase [Acidimicrobiales bacterium]